MKILPAIWAMFTLLFFSFGVYHSIQLNQSFPRFEWVDFEHRVPEFYSAVADITRHNVNRFILEWNEYIGQQNKTSRWINGIAAVTYFVTAFMSFCSIGFDHIKKAVNHARCYCSNAKSHIKRKIRLRIKQRSDKANDD